jgi:hypothetical protein
MSMTDIAELAQVQRPVITTWRRRHPDFPQPAGGDPSSWLFDPRQVADWLVARGTIDIERADQELALYTLAGADPTSSRRSRRSSACVTSPARTSRWPTPQLTPSPP